MRRRRALRSLGWAVLVSAALVGVVGIGSGKVGAQTPCSVVQSSPQLAGGGSVFGAIVSQWKQFFAAKVDANNGTLCNATFVGTVNFTLSQIIQAIGFTPMNPANNLSELTNKLLALATLEVPAVTTGTGNLNICLTSIRTIWRPSAPAPTTMTLPTLAINGQRCVLDNEASSSLYAPTILPGAGQTILSTNGTGNILGGPPGSSVTFAYNAVATQWVLE